MKGQQLLNSAIGLRNTNTLLVAAAEDGKLQNKTKGNPFLKFPEKNLALQ